MPKIYEIATGEKGPGNIIDETVLSQGGAITATTPAFTDDRNLDTSTNTAPTVRRFKRRTTGTPAAGIGAGVDFEVQTAAANFEIGAAIRAITTDVTAGSEDFDLVVYLMKAGAVVAEAFRVSSVGKISSSSNGSETTPIFAGAANRGIYEGAGGVIITNGTLAHLLSSATLTLVPLNGVIGWGANASVQTGQTCVTGFAQKASGVSEANNGTKGSYTGSAFGSGSQTVTQLPSAATAGKGARSFVTDATATTFLSTVAGGGANNVPVVSDGTNWLIG